MAQPTQKKVISGQPQFSHYLVEKGMQLIIQGIGANTLDHNYTDTPERYARALYEMFHPEETEWATFEEEYNDFILLRSHEMASLCPHHFFPVRFKVSLAYIPDGNVLGLSKLARLLHEVNRGPLLQEAFTKSAIDQLYKVCPGVKGAACLVSGVHGCLQLRGVKSSADFVTYRTAGIFDTDSRVTDRFFRLCGEQKVR